MPCDQCEKLHEQWGKEPKCKECMPVLMPGNKDAVKTYLLCRDQMIMSMAGPVALDIRAVEIAMNRCHVKNRDMVFHQVVALGRHFIQKMRDKNNG